MDQVCSFNMQEIVYNYFKKKKGFLELIYEIAHEKRNSILGGVKKVTLPSYWFS